MSDNWEMYFATVDDSSAQMLIDLGIAPTVPDPERPMLLWMWLQLKSPTEEGFASDEEEPRLVEIEDSFIDAVELTTGAVLVGRVTTCGRRQFYFYAKSSEGFEDSVAEAMEAFADDGYEYETGAEEDDEWAHYTEVLYPEPADLQEIFNQRVIEQLSESGDPLTPSRTVEHYANFANEEDRAAFASSAEAAGFKKLSEELSDEDDELLPFGVTLQRDHAVDWDTIDEMTFTLFELAGEHNGQYEGWGSPVVTD
ncbi:MAG: DUF695 domain-containing protein [Planctomycetota bacterium]